MRSLESWLSQEELDAAYTAEYWNDIEEEKKKAWWIADGNYDLCLKFLSDTGIWQDFEQAIELSGIRKDSGCRVADLAAGICWTSALLTKMPSVSEVHAVEFSKHRISDLCEHAFIMLDGESSKFFRYLGSFYDLKIPDGSLDYVFMSQAFHHADRPLHLLLECSRVLRSGGKLVLVGEQFISAERYVRRFFKKLILERRVGFTFYDLFPPDEILGDHYYRVSDYQFMFAAVGMEVSCMHLARRKKAIYVAQKI